MRRISLIVFLVYILTNSAFVFSQKNDDCGVWRWSVKTLTDDEGNDVLNKVPLNKTIDDLVVLERPADFEGKGANFRYPNEKTPVKVKGFIIAHKIVSGSSGDKDYHIVVRSTESKKQLICEIPSPDCSTFKDKPELKEMFGEQRETYNEQIGKPTSKLKEFDEPIEVEIIGVPFFDMSNHGGGHSENGIEIHPVISISRIDGFITASTNSDLETAGIPKTKNVNKEENKMDANTPQNILTIILLGAFLGMVGQGIRVVVGLKKAYDDAANKNLENEQDLIKYKQLALSLFIGLAVGGVAGVLMALSNINVTSFSKETLIAFIAAGYAGTDFIEGFMRKNPGIKK